MPSAADLPALGLDGSAVVAPALAVVTVAACLAARRVLMPAAARQLLHARLDELATDLDVGWLRGRVRPDRRQAWLDVVRRVARDPRNELARDPASLLPDDLPKRHAEPLRRALTDYARTELPRATRRTAVGTLAAGGRSGRGIPGPTARRARRAVVIAALVTVALAVTGVFAVTTDWLHTAWAGHEPALPSPTATEPQFGPGIGAGTEGTAASTPVPTVDAVATSAATTTSAVSTAAVDPADPAATDDPVGSAVRRAAVPRTLHRRPQSSVPATSDPASGAVIEPPTGQPATTAARTVRGRARPV